MLTGELYAYCDSPLLYSTVSELSTPFSLFFKNIFAEFFCKFSAPEIAPVTRLFLLRCLTFSPKYSIIISTTMKGKVTP